MKLLVITYNALMTSTPNGRTMISLLEGFTASEIVNFCVTGLPDKKYCGTAYKVTNSDSLKSAFFRVEKGGVIEPKSAEKTNDVLANDIYKGRKSPWKYYLREIVWSQGKWKGKKLQSWLKEQNFDCIIYMYGDGAALQDFAVYSAKYLGIPLVVYACEEYCFKDYNYLNRNDKSFFFRKYSDLSKAATKRLLEKASALICNTEQLGRLYAETYGITNVKTIMMASDMQFIENTGVPAVEKMRIAYCGSLGSARNQALIDIADALHEVNPLLKLEVYGRADDETVAMLCSCEHIRFHGFISYEQVQEVIRNSVLLVQTTTFDAYYAKDRRFGFSTKNADSLACGTPFFLYESEEIVEMKFVEEHDCAFMAKEKDQLVPVLKSALFDESERKKKVQNAKVVTAEFFNKQKNIDTVHGLISQLCALEGNKK